MNRFSKLIPLTFLAVSCLSPIDYETDSRGGFLVVAGQVSTLGERNIVQVGTTTSAETLPVPLSGVSVRLINQYNEEYTYFEDYNKPGTYLLPFFSGVPGDTYHLEVSTELKSYKSSPEKMPESAGSVSTSFEIKDEPVIGTEGGVSNLPFLRIITNSKFEKTTPSFYLKWSIEETFLLSPTDFPDIMGNIPPPCYITRNADPQKIALFNGQDIQTSQVKDFVVGSRLIDWTFLEKHYLTTYQSSITKEAHEYWRQVNILANQVGSIFDSPPAKIKGNISRTGNPDEFVLGYFQAANENYDRQAVYPYDLPFPLLVENCTFRGYGVNYLPRCLDCLSVPNSSYERPIWF